MTFKLSACVEMLFVPEAARIEERIALAADEGFEFVEFWRHSDKDLDAIETALKETGVRLCGLVAEPMVPLTDPARHDEFLEGLARSIAVAQRLGASVLIAQAGDEIPGVPHERQRAAIVDCLGRAADLLAGTGVTLALEPLNTIVDHEGYFLSSTIEGLDIVDAVGRAEVRLLFDLYHSAVMGETLADVLGDRIDRIVHVHLADAPGRHEPGSGTMDWEGGLETLSQLGYRGAVGLEFRPTESTAAALGAVRDQLRRQVIIARARRR